MLRSCRKRTRRKIARKTDSSENDEGSVDCCVRSYSARSDQVNMCTQQPEQTPEDKRIEGLTHELRAAKELLVMYRGKLRKALRKIKELENGQA